MTYDVAVIGLGGIGSAVVAKCAARGARTVGLEQFQPGHELGSSTGKSRLIRKAYFEDPAYVPLLLRAYDLWRELERDTGEQLLAIIGLLMVGEENASIIAGARKAASAHDLAIELLERREVLARYPMLRLLPKELGVFEPDGGVLVPERATRAHLRIAAEAGAELRFETVVKRWEAKGSGFEISLADGSRVFAHALVLAQGPWLEDALGIPLRVQRNVQAWFAPESASYSFDRFPPFLVERQNLPAPLYGFPDFGDGVKAAFHAHGAMTGIDHLAREINRDRDIAPIVAAMEEWMPGATSSLLDAKACPYTLTPDGHFVLDRHPDYPRAVLCGGFSGHGFKFAPVIGEIAADLALEGGTPHEIGFLSHRRFGRSNLPK
jgi:sarcosine oxidase